MLKILALGYQDRCGKDTAANYIYEKYYFNNPHFKLISFATPLKKTAYDVFSYTGLQPSEFYEKDGNQKLKDVILPSINKTPREIWICFNNLKQMDQNVWSINSLLPYMNSKEDKILIIKDLRFKFEIQFLKSLPNSIATWYKVDRKNSGDGKTNVSDLSDSDFEDRIIDNNQSLKYLYQQVDIIVEKHLI